MDGEFFVIAFILAFVTLFTKDSGVTDIFKNKLFMEGLGKLRSSPDTPTLGPFSARVTQCVQHFQLHFLKHSQRTSSLSSVICLLWPSRVFVF